MLLVAVLFKGLLGRLNILIGVIIGYAYACFRGQVDFSAIGKAAWVGLPEFRLPQVDFTILPMFIPVVLVLVAENVGHVKSVSQMTGRDYDDQIGTALFADGLGTTIAGFGGGSGTTTYGENIGVMAITKVYSVRVIGGAAVISIICSFVGPLAALIQTIPGPVIGGISFLLYGMIGTSGLRILVDNHVDYSKNRNMILTSVIFVTGLSGVTLSLGDVSLSGMTLAAIVAMIMSLVFHALDRAKLTNDV